MSLMALQGRIVLIAQSVGHKICHKPELVVLLVARYHFVELFK